MARAIQPGVSALLASGVSFKEALRAPITVKRALKMSAIVGTILTLINKGDSLVDGRFPPFWQVALTYLVPYCVSSYSTAALLSKLAAENSRIDERAPL